MALCVWGSVSVIKVIVIWVGGRIYKSKKLTIDGYWVAAFSSELFEGDNFEIYRFTQSGEDVHFRIRQFNSSGRIRTFTGSGVLRSGNLSAYYFVSDQPSIQTGVLMMKVLPDTNGGSVLRGRFAEFSMPNDEESVSLSRTAYELRRIHLPLFRKIFFLLGRKVYSSYDTALKKLDFEAKDAISKDDRPIGV